MSIFGNIMSGIFTQPDIGKFKYCGCEHGSGAAVSGGR